MAKFKFRFDAILRLRENERDAARASLAEAYDALRQIEIRRQELAAERKLLDAASSQRRSGSLSIDRLLSDGRYERQLAFDDSQALAAAQKIEAELTRRQAVLAAANASVRQMELLREKEIAAWTQAEAKIEQATLDEVASRGRRTHAALFEAMQHESHGAEEMS